MTMGAAGSAEVARAATADLEAAAQPGGTSGLRNSQVSQTDYSETDA
jgi:hypothetical protein